MIFVWSFKMKHFKILVNRIKIKSSYLFEITYVIISKWCKHEWISFLLYLVTPTVITDSMEKNVYESNYKRCLHFMMCFNRIKIVLVVAF